MDDTQGADGPAGRPKGMEGTAMCMDHFFQVVMLDEGAMLAWKAREAGEDQQPLEAGRARRIAAERAARLRERTERPPVPDDRSHTDDGDR